jgi:hypothetical protein
LFGRLYVPLNGDYTFYEQGPSGMHVNLDGRAIFPELSPTARAYVPNLEAGFHNLDIETRSPGSFDLLYWTTPGNAYYKQRVPSLYLTSPTVTWRDRWAITISHWKWLWWAMTAVVWLFLLSKDSRPVTSEKRVAAATQTE